MTEPVYRWLGFSCCYRLMSLLLQLHLPLQEGLVVSSLSPTPSYSARTSSFNYAHILPFSTSPSIKYNASELYIAGMMSPASEDVLTAIDIALQDFNSDKRYLKTITVKFIYAVTECDAARATKIFFDMMHYSPRKFVLFTHTCPQLTGPLSQISAYWNIYQVSFSDTNPRLSERKKYTNILRVVPSDLAFNEAVLALLQKYDWRRVGTLHKDQSVSGYAKTSRHSYTLAKLADLLEKAGNFKSEDVIHRSFRMNAEQAMKNLKSADVRIIVTSFDADQGRNIFCAAYRLGVYGARYVWIVLGDLDHYWWKNETRQSEEKPEAKVSQPFRSVNCTEDQIVEAARYHLHTNIVELSELNDRVISGRTIEDYRQTFLKALNGRGKPGYYHGYAYDAVWTVGLAAHRILLPEIANLHSLANFTLTSAYNTTTFQGVTGPVAFSNGERLGLITLHQFVNGSYNRVAVYDATEDRQNASFTIDKNITWRGSGPPQDRTLEVVRLENINLTIYATLVLLSSVGIVMAIIVVAINIRFRRHRYIKMSSPKMNNIIIVGCIFSYSGVFLLGADRGLVGDNSYLVLQLCSARAWVIAISFTLSFGAMFSKTWRVHAIFTNITMNKKIIKDYQLVLIVGILLLIDVLILVVWFSTDPLRLHRKRLESELADGGDKRVIKMIEYCGSQRQSMWMGIIYAYKGLLLVVGCFLAWETRHVSIPALNDSKYIGMCVYNVVIMCVSGAAISFLIQDQQTESFLIIAILMLSCTTITLALVFVPKIIELRRDPKGDEKRIRATLRKISRKHTMEQTNNHRIADLYDQNIDLRKILEERQKELEELPKLYFASLEQEGEDDEDSLDNQRRTSRSYNEVDQVEVTVLRVDKLKQSRSLSLTEDKEINHLLAEDALAHARKRVRVMPDPEDAPDNSTETR